MSTVPSTTSGGCALQLCLHSTTPMPPLTVLSLYTYGRCAQFGLSFIRVYARWRRIYKMGAGMSSTGDPDSPEWAPARSCRSVYGAVLHQCAKLLPEDERPRGPPPPSRSPLHASGWKDWDVGAIIFIERNRSSDRAWLLELLKMPAGRGRAHTLTRSRSHLTLTLTLTPHTHIHRSRPRLVWLHHHRCGCACCARPPAVRGRRAASGSPRANDEPGRGV